MLRKLYECISGSKLELLQSKIDFYDYHAGNIMMDGENFKLIDIGNSFAPDTKISHRVLESFKKRFNRRLNVK